MKIEKIVLSAVILLGLEGSLSASNSAEVIFDTKCAMCHSKTRPKDMNNMIAPAIPGVMRHLKMAYPNKDEAVSFMVNYVLNPNKEKAICMPQKIATFGLMPSQKGMINKKDLQKVSEWLFENFPQKGFVGRGMMQNRPTFESMDLNKDGQLTKEEFNAFKMNR